MPFNELIVAGNSSIGTSLTSEPDPDCALARKAPATAVEPTITKVATGTKKPCGPFRGVLLDRQQNADIREGDRKTRFRRLIVFQSINTTASLFEILE
jgi:hypothetical protein